MKRVILVLVLVAILAVGCVPQGTNSLALTKAGDELQLSGAKMVMLSSAVTDQSRNEDEVIERINRYLVRGDIEIIAFSRFYDPVTSRLIRCEIIYRDIKED